MKLISYILKITHEKKKEKKKTRVKFVQRRQINQLEKPTTVKTHRSSNRRKVELRKVEGKPPS